MSRIALTTAITITVMTAKRPMAKADLPDLRWTSQIPNSMTRIAIGSGQRAGRSTTALRAMATGRRARRNGTATMAITAAGMSAAIAGRIRKSNGTADSLAVIRINPTIVSHDAPNVPAREPKGDGRSPLLIRPRTADR